MEMQELEGWRFILMGVCLIIFVVVFLFWIVRKRQVQPEGSIGTKRRYPKKRRRDKDSESSEEESATPNHQQVRHKRKKNHWSSPSRKYRCRGTKFCPDNVDSLAKRLERASRRLTSSDMPIHGLVPTLRSLPRSPPIHDARRGSQVQEGQSFQAEDRGALPEGLDEPRVNSARICRQAVPGRNASHLLDQSRLETLGEVFRERQAQPNPSRLVQEDLSSDLDKEKCCALKKVLIMLSVVTIISLGVATVILTSRTSLKASEITLKLQDGTGAKQLEAKWLLTRAEKNASVDQAKGTNQTVVATEAQNN